MEYKHIRDCWLEIRKAKTIEEVKDLFEKNEIGAWVLKHPIWEE